MKIEDIDKANALVTKIRETESLIEEIRSCTVIRLLTARFDVVWSSDIESKKKELASFNLEYKNNLLSYYDGLLNGLRLELDKL